MGRSWFPRTESGILSFSQTWVARGTASASAYNWSAGDVATLSGLTNSLSSAMTVANDPVTRTSVTVISKDAALAALMVQMKAMKRKLEGALPAISSVRREELGLTPGDVHPTPAPIPATRPIIIIRQVDGRSVRVRLADQTTPSSRKKPAFVSEAEVFSYVGATPPANPADWHYEGQSTKTRFDVTFPAGTVTAQIWIVARWCNRRGQVGPFGAPQSACVGGIAAAA